MAKKKEIVELTPETKDAEAVVVNAYTMMQAEPGSGLYIVVKLTLTDGVVTSVEEMTQPEYKPFAFNYLKRFITQDWG